MNSLATYHQGPVFFSVADRRIHRAGTGAMVEPGDFALLLAGFAGFSARE